MKASLPVPGSALWTVCREFLKMMIRGECYSGENFISNLMRNSKRALRPCYNTRVQFMIFRYQFLYYAAFVFWQNNDIQRILVFSVGQACNSNKH